MEKKSLSIKSKLIISIVIPICILMFSLLISLWDDYTDIKNTIKAKDSIEITETLGKLFDALQEEKTQAILYAYQNNLTNSTDLTQSRELTDQVLRSLKEQYNGFNFTDRSLNQIFNSFFLKFESLPAKRRAVDEASAINIDDIQQSYDELGNEIINRVFSLGEVDAVASTVRTLTADAALLHNYGVLTNLRLAIFSAITQNQMNQKEYETILQLIGQAQAYENLYTEAFLTQQERYFPEIVKTKQFSEFTKTLDILKNKGLQGKFNLDPAKWWDNVTRKMIGLKEGSQKLLNEEDKRSQLEESQKIRNFIIQVILALGLILASLLFALMNIRSLSKQLQEGVVNLANAGQEISNSIVDASSSTAETAAAVTETTTTVEELKQTAQVSAEKAKNVSDISDETLQILKTSEQSLNSTIEGMNNIKDGINTISDTIVKLSEHSQTIGEIIGTVNDLAEQSHLLAINAAIEAAKAEHKGFAVVAQEVRLLAEQSKQATVQVRNILNDIQNATSAAVMATDQGAKAVAMGVDQSQKTTEAVRTMSQKINNLNQAAYQIAISSQQQLIGVGQVTLAMSNIKEASHKQVENMHQIEFGINGLNNVGQSLKRIVK